MPDTKNQAGGVSSSALESLLPILGMLGGNLMQNSAVQKVTQMAADHKKDLTLDKWKQVFGEGGPDGMIKYYPMPGTHNDFTVFRRDLEDAIKNNPKNVRDEILKDNHKATVFYDPEFVDPTILAHEAGHARTSDMERGWHHTMQDDLYYPGQRLAGVLPLAGAAHGALHGFKGGAHGGKLMALYALLSGLSNTPMLLAERHASDNALDWINKHPDFANPDDSKKELNTAWNTYAGHSIAGAGATAAATGAGLGLGGLSKMVYDAESPAAPLTRFDPATVGRSLPGAWGEESAAQAARFEALRLRLEQMHPRLA